MSGDVSGLWRIFTGIFGTNYPMRLAIGASLACLIQTLIHVTSRLIPQSVLWQTMDEFGLVWYLVIITPLMFVTLVFGRQGAPEGVIQQINTVRALIAEGGFSAVQRVMIWRSLIDKYLTALKPDLSRPPQLRDLFEETRREINSGPDPTS